MAARSIASLNLSFGLVSIPVRLYSATESAASVRFNLLAKDGSRVKQQYISETDQAVVARSDMVKGYEVEKDKFVLFSTDELKKLEEGSSHAIEIVAFVPEKSVDPRYYDKAYLLAPDKRGGKPYALLQEAMRSSGKSALAKWAWKAKQYVVQVRATEDGLVLQQLLYAEEVRSFKELAIEQVDVSKAELQLALQLIEQISEPAYDPTQFKDEERLRVLAAIDAKIAGQEVVVATHSEDAPASAQVIDLMAALQASLSKKKTPAVPAPQAATAKKASNVTAMPRPAAKADKPVKDSRDTKDAKDAKARKGPKRAPAATPEAVSAPAPTPARQRAKK
jgi:DNA end-binding protein Ku